MQSLIGNNEHSWGWDLGRNKVYHDSKNQSGETYPNQLSQDETFVVPDKFLSKSTFHSWLNACFHIIFKFLEHFISLNVLSS